MDDAARVRRSPCANFENPMNDAFNQFRQMRWAGGLKCVWCAASRVRHHSVRPSGAQKYLCLECGRIFSDLSGTFLQGSKVAIGKWKKAEAEFSRNRSVTARMLQRACGVSYPTARRMLGVLARMARVRELSLKNNLVFR